MTRALMVKATTVTQTHILLVLSTRYISNQLEARMPTGRCDFPKYVGAIWSVNLRLPPLMYQLNLTRSCGFSTCIKRGQLGLSTCALQSVRRAVSQLYT